MYQKNRLKDLIYIQENKPCSEQTIKGLFRAIVEPIIETSEEALVLLRLEDERQKLFSGLIKRLGFSKAELYDFSDNKIDEKSENILKDKIWDKTEFVYVLSERFGAVLIFDYDEAEQKAFAQPYVFYNSKNLSEAFGIINENSTKDLSEYSAKWHPDRRENLTMNLSIRKIVENLDETNQELIITQEEEEKKEDNTEIVSRLEFLLAKSSYIAHEMRNLLSISNLYTEIIDKQSDKYSFPDKETQDSFENAKECIKKSLKMTSNLLLDFKSLRNAELKEESLNSIIDSAFELSRIYASGKNIKIEKKLSKDVKVSVDENKILTVLINLVKNAIESYDDGSNKPLTIELKTEFDEDNATITVSNNGKAINKELQSKIFEEGFTTKSKGSGLGLVICKKTMEEQFGQLKLKQSDENLTEFELTVLRSE